MATRHPRPHSARALGLGAVAMAALLAASLADPPSSAQPAPDLERAKELYRIAETAMKDGRFADAVRDYGASYELSKDPALFFKIGRANERAGKCDLALIYYARYLNDGKPTEPFVATTRERMRACGGDVRNVPGSAPAEPRPGGAEGSAGAVVEPRPGGGDAPAEGSAAKPVGSAGSGAPGEGSGAARAEPDGGSAGSAAGSGSSEASAKAPVLIPTNRHKVAWVMTGGAIALAALGGVLAYAASSSENDVRDLYVGFGGQPATFSDETRKKYDDLVDQGHRFQHLSWASFGLAGAAAVGAAVLFVIGGRDESAQHARVTPIITPSGAGVSVGF
jgi:hypothetical protein